MCLFVTLDVSVCIILRLSAIAQVGIRAKAYLTLMRRNLTLFPKLLMASTHLI